MRSALVLRPEPGNGATCARLREAGVPALGIPLFETVPMAWHAPDPAGFDALLLTSASAVRHAGAQLSALAHLPVVAVGEATAAAGRAAGLTVDAIGDGNAARAAGIGGARRLLHLAGRDHFAVPGATVCVVYASVPREVPPDALHAAVDGIVLLHSVRAARRFAAIAGQLPRARIRLATLSPAIRHAAGIGWGDVVAAARPTDAALVETARALAIDS